MKKLKYSAGAVSKGFWFEEFKKYILLLKDGNTKEEIKKLQEKNNIFMAPSISYGEKMIGEIPRRTKALPESIIKIFTEASVGDQKLINLLGIMMTDRLFFEFVYETYREEIILGSKEYKDSSSRIFLSNKSEQSEKVAAYTDQTKKRLSGAYKTYLKDANLIIEEDKVLVYRKPVLDMRLESELKKENLFPYLKAITGVS